jgi:hypothetical protein
MRVAGGPARPASTATPHPPPPPLGVVSCCARARRRSFIESTGVARAAAELLQAATTSAPIAHDQPTRRPSISAVGMNPPS